MELESRPAPTSPRQPVTPELDRVLEQAQYLCEKATLPTPEDIDELRRRGKKYHAASRAASLAQPPRSREFTDAVQLANKILDRPSGDPDDDLAVLSRQFLRAIEPKPTTTAVKPDKCPECLGTKGEWIDRKDPRNSTYLQDDDADEFQPCRTCNRTGGAK